MLLLDQRIVGLSLRTDFSKANKNLNSGIFMLNGSPSIFWQTHRSEESEEPEVLPALRRFLGDRYNNVPLSGLEQLKEIDLQDNDQSLLTVPNRSSDTAVPI